MSDAAFLISDSIIDCNISATRLFGISREDLIGRELSDLSPQFQPHGQQSIDAIGTFLAGARTGTPQTFPWVVLKNDRATTNKCYPESTGHYQGALCACSDL